MTTSILIVEAYTVMRHGLRLILQEDTALQVIGEAASGREAACLAEKLTPDVVLMDLHLADGGGHEVIRQIRMRSPRSQVLILTTSDQSQDILAAAQNGAKGYLLKDVSGGAVRQAIHQVAAGQAVLPAQLATRLLDGLSTATPTLNLLTNRERDVLRYLTQGLCNKEIATALSISQNTVKTHIRRILGKLNMRSRTEAASYALQSGLILEE